MQLSDPARRNKETEPPVLRNKAHWWDSIYMAFLMVSLGIFGAPIVLAPWHSVRATQVVISTQRTRSKEEDPLHTLFQDEVMQHSRAKLAAPDFQPKHENFLEALKLLDDFESREFSEVAHAIINAYVDLERKRGIKDEELMEELRKLRDLLHLEEHSVLAQYP